MVHRLLFGRVGQTLSFTPSRRDAVSWVLEDMTVSEQESGRILDQGSIAAPSGGIPTTRGSGPSTPFADRVLVPLAAEVGEMLRITHATTGVSELFTVAGVQPGQYLTTRVPLTTWYPQNSTVDRLRVTTGALPDAVLTDRDRVTQKKPMRVVWTLEHDGSRHQEQVYLVRADHSDIDVPKVLQTVRTLWPDVHTRTEHHGKDTLEGIVVTLAERLKSSLRGRTIPADAFLSGDAGRFTLAYKVLLHLSAMGNRPGNQEADEWNGHLEREYQACFADLTSGLDGDETQQPEPTNDTVPTEKPYRSHFGGL